LAAGHRPELVDTIGAADARFDAAVNRYTMRVLLAALSAQHGRLLSMGYLADMTQAQIAAVMGVSQMQICRVMERTLG
jgi:RNA polymerase sigma-B factor